MLTERELIGTVNLACLFSPTVYLTDVHLGDNPLFQSSYLAGRADGLYSRVKELTALGSIQLLLRDESVTSDTGDGFVCESFTDVYESWVAHHADRGGVSTDTDATRRRYFAALDEWRQSAVVGRYSYRDVKHEFMGSVRSAHASSGLDTVLPELRSLSISRRSAFEEMLDSPWFTLGDVYRFLRDSSIETGDPLWRFHGLINEMACAQTISASVGGVDSGQQTEALLWADRRDVETGETDDDRVAADHPIEWLFEQADLTLSTPDLSLLGVLAPEEIAALRVKGHSAFAMLELISDPAYAQSTADPAGALLRAMAEYWEHICDHLAKSYPHAATRPTKLGLFVGRLPKSLSRVARPVSRVALNVGTPAVAGNPGGALVARGAQSVLDERDLSINFLLSTETESMKRLRAVVPRRCWTTSRRPTLYVPTSR